MAGTQVGGLRTVGSREAVDGIVSVETQTDPAASASRLSTFKHVFQSRITGLVLSPKRRIVSFANNERAEDVPYTSLGARLDMVRFVDGFLTTNDDELAEAVRADKRFGSTFWDYNEKQKEFKAARAAEIRRQLAQDPDLAAAVALTPSEKKDWDLAPAVQPAGGQEMTEEELERLTAPSK